MVSAHEHFGSWENIQAHEPPAKGTFCNSHTCLSMTYAEEVLLSTRCEGLRMCPMSGCFVMFCILIAKRNSHHKRDGKMWVFLDVLPLTVTVRLSHYLQGLIYPRWCRISSINSIKFSYMEWYILIPSLTGESLWRFLLAQRARFAGSSEDGWRHDERNGSMSRDKMPFQD